MVSIISWCALDGHFYFVVRSGWSLLFPGALWMVIVISLVHFGWSLLFPGVLRMVTDVSCCVHKQDTSHKGKHKAKH